MPYLIDSSHEIQFYIGVKLIYCILLSIIIVTTTTPTNIILFLLWFIIKAGVIVCRNVYFAK